MFVHVIDLALSFVSDSKETSPSSISGDQSEYDFFSFLCLSLLFSLLQMCFAVMGSLLHFNSLV